MEAPYAYGWGREGREGGGSVCVCLCARARAGERASTQRTLVQGIYLGPSLEFSTPAAPSGLILRLSPITLVSSCCLPATFQLNHSLKFGAVAKTPLPCNRIFTVSTAAANVAHHLLL